ncbi:hypothetical protein [Sutcliffiella rhizosphaerae]|nr:hypothetical protein [Sutcliffiella rhizosphaerae]
MEFSPVENNDRLSKALNNVSMLSFVEFTAPSSLDSSPMFGTLSIMEHGKLPFMITMIKCEGEPDWLDVSIPISKIEEIFSIQYPLSFVNNACLEGLHQCLTMLAETVYVQSPFQFAMLGHEITGLTDHQSISIENYEHVTFILPRTFQTKLGVNQPLQSQLQHLHIINV